MNTMVLDDCLQNLFYAQEAMKEWIPMTEYEVIFEAAEKTETAEKVAMNEETAEKSTNFIKKAIDAVITMIKKLYNLIKDFIQRCTMKGDEREAFEAFKKAMAEDPALKNKKITVQDFRKLNKQYEELLNEIDKNIRAVKADETHPVEDLTKKVTDFMKGTATSLTVNVAADTALKMAQSNISTAKMIQAALKENEGMMETLAKSFGSKRDAIRFQKEIDKAAKATFLYRLKVKLFRHQYSSLSDALQGTIRSFKHAGFKDASEAKRALKDLKKDKKAGIIDKDEYKRQKKDIKDDLHRARVEARDSLRLDRRLVRNDETGAIIKTTAKSAANAYIDTLKDRASDIVADLVTDRDRSKRDKTGVHAPAHEFLFKKKK